MGGERTTQITNQTTSQQATATPEERELNRLALERQRAIQGQQIGVQQQGFNLVNQLLTGSSDLPGVLGKLPRGIDPEVTQSIVDESLRDVRTSFQGSGILDSGIALETGARVAGDIRRASEEFNIGNLFNLLNLAVGGQAQVQQPVLASSQALGSRLAGLRSVQGTGSGTTTTIAPNPFVSSFLSSAGKSFGTF